MAYVQVSREEKAFPAAQVGIDIIKTEFILELTHFAKAISKIPFFSSTLPEANMPMRPRRCEKRWLHCRLVPNLFRNAAFIKLLGTWGFPVICHVGLVPLAKRWNRPRQFGTKYRHSKTQGSLLWKLKLSLKA